MPCSIIEAHIVLLRCKINHPIRRPQALTSKVHIDSLTKHWLFNNLQLKIETMKRRNFFHRTQVDSRVCVYSSRAFVLKYESDYNLMCIVILINLLLIRGANSATLISKRFTALTTKFFSTKLRKLGRISNIADKLSNINKKSTRPGYERKKWTYKTALNWSRNHAQHFMGP